MGHNIDGAIWRKSSYSGSNGGDCVEVAVLPDDSRAVRDSKDPDGPKLLFSPAEWQTFTAALRNGELDLS
jgi:Domain of unknown function (DUF397)